MNDTDLAARLDRIKVLTDKLADAQRESHTARLLLADIQREIALSRAALQTIDTHPLLHTRR